MVVSGGSAVHTLGVVGNAIHCFVANLKDFPAVKVFGILVKIRRNYRHNSMARFSGTQCSSGTELPA